MGRVKLYDSPEWLRLQFLTNRKTIDEIAAMCGCSSNTIRDRLKKQKLIK